MPIANLRVQTTQFLRRLLESKTIIPSSLATSTLQGWGLDLEQYAVQYLGDRRKSAWGPLSTAVNLYKSFINQLSALASEPPTPTNPAELDEEQHAYLASMELWADSLEHMRNVVGLGDSLKRLTWHSGLGGVGTPGVGVTLVTPDLVDIRDHRQAPQVPVRIEQRTTINGSPVLQVWSFGVIDENEAKRQNTQPDLFSVPYFALVETKNDKWVDVSSRFGEETTWLWWAGEGDAAVPYMPWVLYSLSGSWWNPDPWPEVAVGALDIGLLWSFFQHSIKNASWRQKYGIGVQPAGTNTEKDGRHTMSIDPTTMPLFEPTGDGTATVGVLAEPMDPKSIAEAIQIYVSALLESLGLGGADVQIASPQSGVAIKLRQDTLKVAQKKITPAFRKGDREMLRKVALISNTFSTAQGIPVPQLPVLGWDLDYPSQPMTADEKTERIDTAIKLKDQGAASLVDIWMAAHPSTDRADALVELQKRRAEIMQLAVNLPGGMPT